MFELVISFVSLHKGGWEEIFLPVSETCTDANGASHSSWPGQSNTQVITVPIIDSLNPRPKYLPLAIPADLAPRMMKLHGDPIVWWIGQFLKVLILIISFLLIDAYF